MKIGTKTGDKRMIIKYKKVDAPLFTHLLSDIPTIIK